MYTSVDRLRPLGKTSLPGCGREQNDRVNSPALHERLEPLSFLLGTWRGLGVVGYPTIEERQYEQELVFAHDGRPFLEYSSRTWILDADGARVRPAAREAGWWRPGADPRGVELLLAHPTGIVEVYVGEVAFHKIELRTDVVARTETAKPVTALHRLYGLVEGDLAYAIDLAAVGQPLQPHLSARLAPVRDRDRDLPHSARGRVSRG